jgi:hypothetical protein
MKAYLGNEAKFTRFRTVSAQFRQRQLSTDQYWTEFLSIFGKDATALDLFEALTELLPESEADLRDALLTTVAAARLAQGPARVDATNFPSLGNSTQSVSLSTNYSSLLRPSAPPSRDEFPALTSSRGPGAGAGGRPGLHSHQYFQQHPSLLPNFYARGANSNSAPSNPAPAPNQGQGQGQGQSQGQGQGKKKNKKQVVFGWG